MRHNQTGIVVTATVAVLAFTAAIAGAPVLLLAALGLPSVAAPGYVWAKVLLGSRAAGLEWVAVATGLSLAVPVLGGVALFAAGVPLHRTAWASLLAGVTLAGDITLLIWNRDGNQPATVQSRPQLRSLIRRTPIWHAVMFGAAIVLAAGAVEIAHVGAASQHFPGFTELWLTPSTRSASVVDLGVTNRQGTTTRYRLVYLLNGLSPSTWTFTLADGQTWRRQLSFDGLTGSTASLYRMPDLSHPYRHVAIAADPASGP